MYSFKDKCANVNYVLNIRCIVLQKITFKSYNMVHAGIYGVAKHKCILVREWHEQVQRCCP